MWKRGDPKAQVTHVEGKCKKNNACTVHIALFKLFQHSNMNTATHLAGLLYITWSSYVFQIHNTIVCWISYSDLNQQLEISVQSNRIPLLPVGLCLLPIAHVSFPPLSRIDTCMKFLATLKAKKLEWAKLKWCYSFTSEDKTKPNKTELPLFYYNK